MGGVKARSAVFAPACGGVLELHLCAMNRTYVRMYLRMRLRAVFNTFINVFKRLKARLDKALQDATVRKPG